MENTRQPINSIGPWLKNYFGEKTIKLSIDGQFTCPNRDGKVGTGGCIFCSAQGSGELASTIPEQIEMLKEKWPNVSSYLAYFQSHTSTYDEVSNLRYKFYEAINHPSIYGLVISTRPDCLSEEILDLLSEINQKTFLWVELGLQTIHGDKINRCYTLEVYDEAVSALISRGIKVVTHLILGLPGESKEDMIASLIHVCNSPIFGIKLHLMNLIKGSALSKTNPDYVSFSSIDEYINLVCELLTIIPENITIHRLTGDVPRKLLISPEWSYKKRTILNGIALRMKTLNLYQGCAIS